MASNISNVMVEIDRGPDKTPAIYHTHTALDGMKIKIYICEDGDYLPPIVIDCQPTDDRKKMLLKWKNPFSKDEGFLWIKRQHKVGRYG